MKMHGANGADGAGAEKKIKIKTGGKAKSIKIYNFSILQ